jgi:hypothetical protein
MRCQYFKIQELVSPKVYEERGEKAWALMDPRLLETLDWLRSAYGPMIINNWHSVGTRKFSGLRMPFDDYYSKYSQHSFGRAADILFTRHSVDTVIEDIIRHPNEPIFKHIKGLELDVTWLHIDVRNSGKLITFRP